MDYGTFVSKKIDVDFPTIADEAVVLPRWNEPPDAHATYDLALLRTELPVDCTTVVVPRSFASFVSGFTPVLTVNHVVVEDGVPTVADSSFIATVPHAPVIFLRMMRLGKPASAASVTRLRVRLSTMATVWSEVEASSKLSEHFVSEVPLSSTAGMVALRKFQQEECA